MRGLGFKAFSQDCLVKPRPAGHRDALYLDVQNALNTLYRDYSSMLSNYADTPVTDAFLGLVAESDLDGDRRSNRGQI